MNPLAPDEMMNVWHSEETGTFEFICGWKAARELLSGGMTKINDKPVKVEVVGHWPSIAGIQIRASTSDRPQRGPL